MHVLVIGAGLAGVTAAWELQQSGHSVTVLDRQPEVAAETSYANAGLVAPGHATPWASPRVPGMLLKSLFGGNQAYRLRPRLDWHMARWGMRFLRQCTHRRHAENMTNQYRLCRYAQSRLHETAKEAGIDYHAQRQGLLYVFRSDASRREGAKHLAVIQSMGHEARLVGPDEVVELEPAFAQAGNRITGAVYCPTDESGDARLFSLALAEACRRRSTEFVLGCSVERIVTERGRVRCLRTSAGDRDADLYVLASGVEAPWLTRPIGIGLPIYPVKGYSLTLPVESRHDAPSMGGLDEDHLIAFSRLGNRLRVTSTAEIAGYDVSYGPADFEPMIRSFSALMPQAADYGRPEYWSCLRPMTPNGQPIVGPSRYENLYFNVGHGNMGWTTACGTARLLADLINGQGTGIPVQPMSLH